MEVVGIALAIPGLIDVLIRGGEFIVEKIDTYQNVDETLDRYVRLLMPHLPLFVLNVLGRLTVQVTDSWVLT
jgi:hypothetical protein